MRFVINDGFESFADIGSRDGCVWIESLSVHPMSQKQGIGTRLLNDVLKYADENSITLHVWPVPHPQYGMREEKLIAWYARFGFTKIPNTEFLVRNA